MIIIHLFFPKLTIPTAEMTTVVCHSTKEANHLLESFNSFVKNVIVITESSSIDELKCRYASRIQIFSFTELLVRFKLCCYKKLSASEYFVDYACL